MSKVQRNRGGSSRQNPYSRGRDGGKWKHDLFQNDQNPRSSQGPDTRNWWKVKIENLHWNVTEEDLEELFGNEIGSVENVILQFDSAGRSNGVAFITFLHVEAADRAIAMFDGQELDGMAMQISSVGPVSLHTKGRSSKRASSSQGKGILSRLGPPSKLDNRLGKKIQDRLGPRVPRGKQSNRGGKPTPSSEKKPLFSKMRRNPVSAEALDAEMDAYMQTEEEEKIDTNAAALAGKTRQVVSYAGTDVVEAPLV